MTALPDSNGTYAVEIRNVNVYYGPKLAVNDINIPVNRNKITAFIGPSGCGKSTVLRTINRMNDLVASARVEGEVFYRGENLYAPHIDAVEIRRRIGMVFQKPNPFPKSIFENVAYGPRVLGINDRATLSQIVEQSLRQAALWDEVKDDLKKSGLALSGGQQQRLCIARTLAVEPDVILMDEPCSALDPIATQRIEDLMKDLSVDYSIVIVTHNMQQAVRVSDYTAFFTTDESRTGELVEFGPTEQLFSSPNDERTSDYIAGRFG
jgi:phosphate transport system ATP-binding protein